MTQITWIKYVCKWSLAILLSFFTLASYSQALLKAVIHDLGSNRIFLLEPIGGSPNSFFKNADSELFPDSVGKLEVALSYNSPVMICLEIAHKRLVLFFEPSDTVELEIDVNKYLGTSNGLGNAVIVKGKSAKGIELYNTFYPLGNKRNEFNHWLDSMHYRVDFDPRKMAHALNQQTASFGVLLKNREISDKFYQVAIHDIKGALIGNVIDYLFYYQKKLNINEVFEIVDGLYLKYPFNQEMVKIGLNGRLIAQDYYFTKARKYYHNAYLPDSTIYINGKKIVIGKDLVPWLFAPPSIQEVEWPLQLLMLKRHFPGDFGNNDMTAFLTLFPNSPVKEYFNSTYYPDNRRSNQIDSAAIRFIHTNYDKIGSLLSSEFKGKKVLVDFWGTWCLPCKQQFSYNLQIDSFCKRNNIEKLYIAFELPTTTIGKVKDDIYKYNLEGFHVIASELLKKDITKTIYRNSDGNYSIPRYLLINEAGKIVNEDAPKPNETDKLFSVMKREFNIPGK